MPLPRFLGLAAANVHDLTALRPILEHLRDCTVFADKAYCDARLQAHMGPNQAQLVTPLKHPADQCGLVACFDAAYRDLFNTAVATVRQPIESFFNWLQQRTRIQDATKVRSQRGLLLHVWGKLTAALCIISSL